MTIRHTHKRDAKTGQVKVRADQGEDDRSGEDRGEADRRQEEVSYPKFGKTLEEIRDEVREVNIAHGWRSPEGGPGANTFGDYIALLHSEASEALEAYRDHRLEDATEIVYGSYVPKPEGVGSELADVLIRLVDMADIFGIDLETEYRRKITYNRTRPYQHGGRTLAGSDGSA